MALAVFSMKNNRFDADNFEKLADSLRKNPYPTLNVGNLPVGDPSSTKRILEDAFGKGGAFQGVGLDPHAAEIFSKLLCAESYREGIDYLVYEWPLLGTAPPAYDC